MFARFDKNPAMTLQVIKETKRYGRTDGRTDARTHGQTDGQRENSIPPTNKVCGGYNKKIFMFWVKGLKIFNREGTHVFLILFFFWKKI